MKKLAVIFPGVGYHTDKPLLYYAKKLAKQKDYEIIELKYKDLPENIKGDPQKMSLAFDIAYTQTEKQLKEIDYEEYDKICFISKSIGTVIAASYDRGHELKARHIYFTPVPQTFMLAGEESGTVFHGLDDPWCQNPIVEKGCRERELPLFTYETANHSLETGDAIKDLGIMTEVMGIVDRLLDME